MFQQPTKSTKQHSLKTNKQCQTSNTNDKQHKPTTMCLPALSRRKGTKNTTKMEATAASSLSASSLTTKAATARSSGAATTHQKQREMSKDPPGVTGRTAAKAKTMRTKASATVDAAAPEIPKNLVEIWKVSVSRAKLLNIHSEEEATIEPDGSLM